jgi:pimeloyl-ACP methyl ester carboxylesterase
MTYGRAVVLGACVVLFMLAAPPMGAPSGEPVLILHGTTGSGAGLLAPAFGGELFGPGQPLDASRYYVILPDAIGHGKSSKPSDGLRTQLLDQRLASPFTADANDVLYQWDSSRDYNPSPGLERIQAILLAINSADDERNPPELGILETPPRRAVARGASGGEVGTRGT